MVEEKKSVIKEKAVFENPRKEEILSDREDFGKLTTDKERIEFLAKKMGLIE